MIINGNVITAEEGMVLEKGTVRTDKVYLGIHDSPENWREIPESQEPDNDVTEEDFEEALTMLGVI